ncbi:hypothetical protein [Kitasatospora sp. NPDC008115]|uniref:hypothetical protein n=1 Tax=Kitasatospora sp. NPDC008115 TaxID=3364022 RepID=UPI0036E74D2F
MSSTAAEQTVSMDKNPATTAQTPQEPKPRRPRPGKGVPLDWVAGHGPVSAPVAMATTSAAVASLGSWTGLPPVVPLAVGAVGALVHGGIQGHRQKMSGPTMLTRATGWLLASGWTSVVIATDPTSWTAGGWWTAAGTLAASAIGVGGALHRADVHEEAVDEDRRVQTAALKEAEANREDWATIRQWMALVHTVTRQTGIEFKGFRRRANSSGFALQVSLPLGYPLAQLQGCAATLAQAARLEQGCLVRIGAARLQGEAILDVDLRNTNAEVAEYPGDFSPLSIYQGMPWGVDRTGEHIDVHIRESCALIVGPPGAGKTTLLDSIFASGLRCVDLVFWGIDLGKEGGAFRPWLETYKEGRLNTGRDPRMLPPTTKPAFDWVATTVEEAELMLAAAERISDARIAGYQDLMREQDVRGSLPMSAKLPMIVIVVDEGVQILSDTSRNTPKASLRQRIKDIIGTDREAGIRMILTATDGNLTSIGDTVIQKHSAIRVAMTATDENGAGVSKLFGHIKGLDARQLTAMGSGVIGARTHPVGFAPQPFRSWKTKPSIARDACTATERLRPRMDAISAQAGGDAYALRWSRERAAWLFSGGQDGAGPAAQAPAAKGGSGGVTLRPPSLFSRPQSGLSVTEEERAMMEQAWGEFLDSLPEEPKPTPPKTQLRPPTLFSRGQDGPVAGPAGPQSSAADSGDPEWLMAALAVLAAAGPDAWMATSGVLEKLPQGITIHRSVLSGGLAKAAREGRIRTRGKGGHTEYSTNAG